MKSHMRWNYAARAPKIAWNLLARGRYDFTFDLMPMHSRNMSWAKRMNLLRAGLNLIHRSLRPWSWPLHMQIELTNRCNLSCPVCPTGRGLLDREPQLMDLSLFEKLMNEVGRYLLCAFLWGWGEPLLHPHLAEFVRITNAHGVLSVLSTNGQALGNPRVVEQLLAEPPTYLIVAIDGLTDETNSVYRVGAKLEPILRGVQAIVLAKRQRGLQYPQLHMRYIVMKHNQHEVARVRAFAQEHGFDLLSMRGLSLIDAEGEPQREMMPDLPEYQAYKYDAEHRVARDDYVCMHAFCLPGVFVDGTVVPCDQDYNASHAYGRFGEDGTFADLWFGRPAAAIRKIIRDDRCQYSVCANCPYADHQKNTCSFELWTL